MTPLMDLERQIDVEAQNTLQRIELLAPERLPEQVGIVQEQIAGLEQNNRRLEEQLAHNRGRMAEVERYQNPFAQVVRAVQVDPEVHDTALRRRLRAELTALFDCVKQTASRDEMTSAISLWAHEFWEALLQDDTDEEIFTSFVQLMQELLVEPIYNTPFDEEPILGSDGVSYGNKAYIIWKDKIDAVYKGRAPMNIDRDELFTFVPHPVVKYAVNWLKSHNKLQNSDWINNTYNEIILRPRLERIARIKAAMVIQEPRKEPPKADPAILAPLKQAEKKVDELVADVAKRIDKLKIDHPPEPANGAPKQLIQDVRAQIAVLNKQIAVIEARNVQLAKKQAGVGQNIKEVEGQSSELQRAINNVQIAIKKQKKQRLGGVLTAVAVVAGCVLATYGIGALTGVAAGPAPMANGMQFHVGFFF